ncbi:hypothetical protein PBRA_008958 [Plasmodiophora brassicae]|uniref:Putative rRNA methyltransferase n=1 Tax=Plasmodiophora brassicae TaxID=37360 RepID=A0A0G4J4S1_PLABS|nr:hypothetical protein PBRA_008958 [Plasmodiophora brassicae]
MVRKTKTAKTRLDKYYRLAKEQGFRSRAAFKLIQLNRKYDFLSSARALIDLCAAPGGWLQVAAKYMPVSSLIVGVDLDPIRAIPNVRAFQEDITTASCRTAIKGAMQGWKADVVLNDGSPNVGGAWTKDAYGQAELSLMALKLAIEFLRPGGLFITKVFRSQDSNSLLWVARQLFDRVDATKPSASRGTSAEIYFVCQGYKAPDKVDPRLLDPSHVFKAIESGPAPVNVLRDAPMKQKRHRSGYDDGVMVLHKSMTMQEFLDSPTPAETLAMYNAIVLDDIARSHPATTDDIRAACADLKVLGRRDFKQLLQWRRTLRAHREQVAKQAAADAESDGNDDDGQAEDEPDEAREARETDELEEARKRMEARLKRAKRKRKEQKTKARLRQLGMVTVEDNEAANDEEGLFALNAIESGAALRTVVADDAQAVDVDEDDNADESDDDDDDSVGGVEILSDSEAEAALERELDEQYAAYKAACGTSKKRRVDVGLGDDTGAYIVDNDADRQSAGSDDDDDEDKQDPNPLNIDLDNLDDPAELSSRRKAQRWFSRDLFASCTADDANGEVVADDGNGGAREDADDDVKADPAPMDDGASHRPLVLRPRKGAGTGDGGAGFEEVPVAESDDEWPSDSDEEAEMLAVGKMLLRKKSRRDLEDASYNRYAWQDDPGLPSWFVDDQRAHNRPILPVSKGDVDLMKARLAAINARPIKKIAEARARKKLTTARRWEKVKSAAESIAGNSDLPDKEKMRRLDSLYKTKGKKAKGGAKPQKQYVVARKSGAVRPNKATGSKRPGRIKMVDKRLKADKRGRDASQRQRKKTTTKKHKSK